MLMLSVNMLCLWLFQEAAAPVVGWDPISLWRQMGTAAKLVVILLFGM